MIYILALVMGISLPAVEEQVKDLAAQAVVELISSDISQASDELNKIEGEVQGVVEEIQEGKKLYAQGAISSGHLAKKLEKSCLRHLGKRLKKDPIFSCLKERVLREIDAVNPQLVQELQDLQIDCQLQVQKNTLEEEEEHLMAQYDK